MKENTAINLNHLKVSVLDAVKLVYNEINNLVTIPSICEDQMDKKVTSVDFISSHNDLRGVSTERCTKSFLCLFIISPTLRNLDDVILMMILLSS